MATSNLERARDFLQAKRIALVGASRSDRDFSRMVMRELVQRGYDVVPVNPGSEEVQGRRCFRRVQDVSPPAEAALLMTPPARSEEAVRDCVSAGVRRIWFHKGGGPGAESAAALAACAAAGIEPVRDLCPFMALPGAGFPHRVHGFFRRAFGRGHG